MGLAEAGSASTQALALAGAGAAGVALFLAGAGVYFSTRRRPTPKKASPGSRARCQLVYAELAEHTLPEAAFGIGDRAGLRLLGAAAGCVDVPPLPPGAPTPR